MDSLADFLLKRKIDLKKDSITSNEIKSDKLMLAKVGALLNDHGDVLRLIIEARMAPIREELLLNATPYEVLPLRQALVEIAMLLDDIEGYKTASDNLRKEVAEKTAQMDEQGFYAQPEDGGSAPLPDQSSM